MSQETFFFVIQMLAVALVVVPWWLYRRLRGLPFDDGAAVQPDAFYWWAVSVLWVVFAGLAFLIGRWNGMFLFLGAMTGLALLWASVWTVIQSLRRRSNPPSSHLLPMHKRFLANFRSTLLELPARLLDGL